MPNGGDELFALLSTVKAGEVSAGEAIQRLSRSPHWVWAAIDPVSKLLLAIDVGDRTLAMAQRVVHQVAQVLAPGCVPLFLTDGFKEYKAIGQRTRWQNGLPLHARFPRSPRTCLHMNIFSAIHENNLFFFGEVNADTWAQRGGDPPPGW